MCVSESPTSAQVAHKTVPLNIAPIPVDHATQSLHNDGYAAPKKCMILAMRSPAGAFDEDDADDLFDPAPGGPGGPDDADAE